MSGYVGI